MNALRIFVGTVRVVRRIIRPPFAVLVFCLMFIPPNRRLGQFRRLLLSDCVQLLSELKAGEVFSFPDGTQVGPADIFLGAPHPRKICFAFDTCDASRLLPFARGADILVSATAAG